MVIDYLIRSATLGVAGGLLGFLGAWCALRWERHPVLTALPSIVAFLLVVAASADIPFAPFGDTEFLVGLAAKYVVGFLPALVAVHLTLKGAARARQITLRGWFQVIFWTAVILALGRRLLAVRSDDLVLDHSLTIFLLAIGSAVQFTLAGFALFGHRPGGTPGCFLYGAMFVFFLVAFALVCFPLTVVLDFLVMSLLLRLLPVANESSSSWHLRDDEL